MPPRERERCRRRRGPGWKPRSAVAVESKRKRPIPVEKIRGRPDERDDHRREGDWSERHRETDRERRTRDRADRDYRDRGRADRGRGERARTREVYRAFSPQQPCYPLQGTPKLGRLEGSLHNLRPSQNLSHQLRLRGDREHRKSTIGRLSLAVECCLLPCVSEPKCCQ